MVWGSGLGWSRSSGGLLNQGPRCCPGRLLPEPLRPWVKGGGNAPKFYSQRPLPIALRWCWSVVWWLGEWCGGCRGSLVVWFSWPLERPSRARSAAGSRSSGGHVAQPLHLRPTAAIFLARSRTCVPHTPTLAISDPPAVSKRRAIRRAENPEAAAEAKLG